MLAARRQLGRPGGAAGDERQRAPRLSDWLLRAVLPPGVDKDNTVLAGTIARTLAQARPRSGRLPTGAARRKGTTRGGGAQLAAGVVLAPAAREPRVSVGGSSTLNDDTRR